MSYQGKKVVGVWMDYQNAFIISSDSRMADGDFVMLKKIERQGHKDDVYKDESFELSKNKSELKKYYKAITDEIDQDDAIFIFGPGKSQEEIKNVLEDIHLFKNKEIKLGSSDKINLKQMVSKVEAHFKG